MTMRLKLVLALVALSSLAAVTIGWFSYRSTEAQSFAALDASLNSAAEGLRSGVASSGRGPRAPGPGPGNQTDRLYRELRSLRSPDDVVWQVVDDGGTVIIDGAVELPAPPDLGDNGPQSRAQLMQDVDVDGEPFRMLTVSLPDGGSLQVARSLSGIDGILSGLRREIALASIVIAGVAALVGWLIARRVTAPLLRVTRTAERVAATGDLGASVPVDGGGEAARLATSFNEMLAALRRSKEQQQRLVQDAGHELRTPLTSLRTNVFMLDRWDRMAPDQRSQIVADLRSETDELTELINEVVGAATDQVQVEPESEVAFGELVRGVADRVAARTGRTIDVEVDDSVVTGRPQLLDRAINNLLVNACKFDSGDSPVQVRLHDGVVSVRDHGPGIDPIDRPLVFERFYRSDTARSAPGSGLGLSIVNEVARLHGGSVFVADPPDSDGGVVVGLTLPTA